jgi:hypothetical protein
VATPPSAWTWNTHNDTSAVEVYRRAGMRPLGAADQWYVTYA